jgi:hypothetical protein
VVADQVTASRDGHQVISHKDTVRFKAASATGPGDLESRDVWVTLSLADVAVLIGALPATWFDPTTWQALNRLRSFIKTKAGEIA